MKRLVESPIWVCPVCVQLPDPGSVWAKGEVTGVEKVGREREGVPETRSHWSCCPSDPDGLFLATIHSPSAGVWLQSLSLGGVNA